MWITIWTGGDSIMERPLCLLVHYLLCVDVLCLLTAQLLSAILLGPSGGPVSLPWFVATAVLVLLHVAFGFLFTWIDGEEFRIGAGAEFDRDGGSGDGGSGDGGSGDGSSSG